ncbi:MAG: hypothetical protein KF855_08495 [Acidobacteria bacterium]|nr:hypothetical protein [Acidobacteriota bacterium]
MKISEQDDVMVISQAPGLMWLLGGFFIIVSSLFIYGASGGYSNISEMSFFARTTHLVLGFAGVSAGIFALHSAPYVRLRIDRRDQAVSLKKHSIFSRHTAVFAFDDVSGLRVGEDRDSDGDPIWALVLELADGNEIEVSSLKSPDEQFKRDFAFRANGFMHKELPSAVNAVEKDLNDEDPHSR